MRKTGLIPVLLLMTLLVLAGCGGKNQVSEAVTHPEETVQKNFTEDLEETNEPKKVEELSNEDEISETEDEIFKNEEDQNIIEQPAFSQWESGPYLGKLVEGIDLPLPVMVMVENSPAARPQIGLDQASIVYEFLVEGGITRFLALYYENFPAKVGPVRSTRPYFIDTALEYDALLLHVGASAEGFHLLETSGIAHLDQISDGAYYFRDYSRRAPHNVYTGKSILENLWDDPSIREDVKSRFPYQIIGLVNQATVRKADDIKIHYWGGYTVGYKYDEKKGEYLRFIDGFPHLLEGGKKIYADNIFVQYVDTNIIDDEGRLNMETVGTGKALLFKDGFIFLGNWSKEKGEKTYFLDDRGNEWQINPGQTWIQVVPLSVKVDF